MTKVKEISEEKFFVLAELGIPTMWDLQPFFERDRVHDMLVRFHTEDTASEVQEYIDFTDGEVGSNYCGGYKFYTLVEGSAERSEDE